MRLLPCMTEADDDEDGAPALPDAPATMTTERCVEEEAIILEVPAVVGGVGSPVGFDEVEGIRESELTLGIELAWFTEVE